MNCSYVGNFDSHHTIKKRRLIGPAREKAISPIIDKNISAETFRGQEANRLMKIGNVLKCTY